MRWVRRSLSEEFWDCECEAHYIHSNSEACCPICGATREERPPSRADEVADGKHFSLLVKTRLLLSEMNEWFGENPDTDLHYEPPRYDDFRALLEALE